MVLAKTKKLTDKFLTISQPNTPDITAEDVKTARLFIAQYWPKLTRFNPKDTDSLIGLPKPYLVPAYEQGHEFDFNELYYWDSYFMIQGLLDQSHKDLNIGILEDLTSMFKRYGIIPNASRTYLTGRSQPPLLSTFILDLYQTYKLDKEWLADAMGIAAQEYRVVWTGITKPHARQVYQGLSRYYSINYLQDLAETESGWDYTPRFNRHCLDYLPIDLNCMLFKYETDFAYTARLLGNEKQAIKWDTVAARRQQTVNKLMWNDQRSFFYDYNYAKESRASVTSLAAYFTMWSGLANQDQAASLVKNLARFEVKGGLSTTESLQLGQLVPGAVPTQWAYPNGWAPLHFIVVKGLQRYGYHDDAKRIALKWLKTNLDWFNKYGVFLEKYNVAQPDKPPAKGVYPSQTGFGWTNSIFEYFCQQFIDND